MTIWNDKPTLGEIIEIGKATMVEALNIEFIEIGEDFLSARMPVDHRTIQPAGILHGGASVALAETLGSVAANFCVDRSSKYCVGLDINANHIRSVRNGYVFGTARPLHQGKTTQVWEIKIENDRKQLVCISRLTMAVLNHP